MLQEKVNSKRSKITLLKNIINEFEEQKEYKFQHIKSIKNQFEILKKGFYQKSTVNDLENENNILKKEKIINESKIKDLEMDLSKLKFFCNKLQVQNSNQKKINLKTKEILENLIIKIDKKADNNLPKLSIDKIVEILGNRINLLLQGQSISTKEDERSIENQNCQSEFVSNSNDSS